MNLYPLGQSKVEPVLVFLHVRGDPHSGAAVDGVKQSRRLQDHPRPPEFFCFIACKWQWQTQETDHTPSLSCSLIQAANNIQDAVLDPEDKESMNCFLPPCTSQDLRYSLPRCLSVSYPNDCNSSPFLQSSTTYAYTLHLEGQVHMEQIYRDSLYPPPWPMWALQEDLVSSVLNQVVIMDVYNLGPCPSNKSR